MTEKQFEMSEDLRDPEQFALQIIFNVGLVSHSVLDQKSMEEAL